MNKTPRLTIVACASVMLTLAACTGLPPAPPPAPQPASSDLQASAPGLTPDQISLNTQGLADSWQASVVPATPYDNSTPPGPTGLPEHILITFNGAQPESLTPSDPALYIIPVAAYETLWADAGDDAISKTMQAIYRYTVALQQPPPLAGMPALPPEQVGGGVNDLAAQIGRAAATDESESATKSGYRFVGRWAQDANPVTNQGLRYVYQGFTNDGVNLVAFFSPITSPMLPDSADQLPPVDMQQFEADPAAYLTVQAEALNALTASDWQPNLDQLDAVVASLRIAAMPAHGLQGPIWQLVAQNNQGVEQLLSKPENYTVVFETDGQLAVQADCNRMVGTYTAEGGSVGNMRTQLGPSTLAACGPDSHADLLVNVLASAQNYKVRPGGESMELIQPAGGTVLIFERAGLAAQ